MVSLQQIESDLKDALKARDQVAADTLRGLKTRIQNEQTVKGRPVGQALLESEIVALIRSEVKRRKEAAESFYAGGRPEMAEKELKEAAILEKYLPAQLSEAELGALVDRVISETSAVAADFGKVMGALKKQVGDKADGAVLAKLLKEKLK